MSTADSESTMGSESAAGSVLRWTAPDENAPQAEFSAPLGSLTSGNLRIESGATNVTISAEESPDLIRARFKRPYPTVEVWNGTVTINYRHDRLKDWLSFRTQPAADLVLNSTVPWSISTRGGVSDLRADLSRLQLRSFETGGGVSGFEIVLPKPSGTVPIRIGGGASKVTIRRPSGVPVRLATGGGVSGLAFDEQRLGAIGGRYQSESPDHAAAADRYEITIDGGVSQISVTTQ